LPILVLTADITAPAKQRALLGGAKDFLSKPFDPDEVLARIKNLLETRALHLQLHDRNRVLQDALRALDEERELSERLLLNVMPRTIAERLKRKEGIIADSFADVTVLFADIANFSALSAQLPPEQLVAWLNEVFSAFDHLAEQHRLEKIKTVGDSYMVVSGLPAPRADHAEAIADLSLALREEMQRHTTPRGERLQMRIGIHSGPVVAGVIGKQKFAYDLWGDTVNIASRMESHGVDGAIQVSSTTYELLRHAYHFEARGEIGIKNRGEVQTYLLTGKSA
jgi:class 3 adenylate cyclase